MVVLERTLVGVGERARRLYLDLVGVVGARVVEVVDDRARQRQLELAEAADEAVARALGRWCAARRCRGPGCGRSPSSLELAECASMCRRKRRSAPAMWQCLSRSYLRKGEDMWVAWGRWQGERRARRWRERPNVSGTRRCGVSPKTHGMHTSGTSSATPTTHAMTTTSAEVGTPPAASHASAAQVAQTTSESAAYAGASAPIRSIRASLICCE